MTQIYEDGAVVTYSKVTGTIAPTTGVVLDGSNLSAGVPQTILDTPKQGGVYLVSVTIRLLTPASGSGALSTCGPVILSYVCADSHLPVTDIICMSTQDGLPSTVNTGNAVGNALCGSAVICAKAGSPIYISVGYQSSGTTPTCTATCTLTSAAWNVAGIEVRGVPVYVGGNGVFQSGGATTETVAYSPTAGNAAVLYFATGAAITGLTVKDNLGHTLSPGSTSGLLATFYQYPVPAGVTSYTATWTTARQSSLTVEEYSGITAINASLPGNTASGSSGVATLTVTDEESGDITVYGFSSASILTATVGNQRHQTTGSTARLTTVDNTSAGPMFYTYHAKCVYLGGLPS